MPMGILFWVLMLLCALFGIGGFAWPADSPYRRHVFGGWGLVVFVLFALLGWKVFGPVLQ